MSTQSRKGKHSYQSQHEKLVATKSERVLTSIRPNSAEDARDFLAACNELDAPTSVKEHFAEWAGQL